MLQALKVPDLCLDIVLSLEIGAPAGASCGGSTQAWRYRSQRIARARPREEQKYLAKGDRANPSAGHGRTRWVMNDALYAVEPSEKYQGVPTGTYRPHQGGRRILRFYQGARWRISQSFVFKVFLSIQADRSKKFTHVFIP
ncbi:hypothetical protein ACSZMY_11775 [Aeromonas hydrophila]